MRTKEYEENMQNKTKTKKVTHGEGKRKRNKIGRNNFSRQTIAPGRTSEI
jgi:hypothetical protein